MTGDRGPEHTASQRPLYVSMAPCTASLCGAPTHMLTEDHRLRVLLLHNDSLLTNCGSWGGDGRRCKVEKRPLQQTWRSLAWLHVVRQYHALPMRGPDTRSRRPEACPPSQIAMFVGAMSHEPWRGGASPHEGAVVEDNLASSISVGIKAMTGTQADHCEYLNSLVRMMITMNLGERYNQCVKLGLGWRRLRIG